MSIHKNAKIGKGVSIGSYVVIEEGVIIGDYVTIGHHCIIKSGVVLKDHIIIGDMVILGQRTSSNKKMARKPSKHLGELIIEEDTIIGSQVTLYKGSKISEGVFLADYVSIREQVEVGSHSIIGRQAMIEPNTSIGSYVTIQTGSYITADTIIEDEVFIGPCCSMSNDKYMASGKGIHKGPIIRKGAKIGNNATLLPEIEIGEQAVVGAGAVVTKSIPAQEVFVGNPARKLV
ncbi:DapH/DapD/GlmU-related protein [Priestia filamentosa]|uniref:N-acetyltransferase n=1 Tax=Priestia filamentosa TaxID=1402861 RepID=UPI003978526C